MHLIHPMPPLLAEQTCHHVLEAFFIVGSLCIYAAQLLRLSEAVHDRASYICMLYVSTGFQAECRVFEEWATAY